MSEIIVIETSLPSAQEAHTMAHELISQKLVACCHVVQKMESTFVWEGQIVQPQEAHLSIKTLPYLQERTCAYIKEHHPYTVPELLIFTCDAESSYFEWMKEAVVSS